MSQKHIAELYYIAMGQKDISAVAEFLHPEVVLKSPAYQVVGKEAVVLGAKEHSDSFTAMNVREVVGNGDKAFVICETVFPFGTMTSASLVSVKDGLISSIELFFDTGFFQPK